MVASGGYGSDGQRKAPARPELAKDRCLLRLGSAASGGAGLGFASRRSGIGSSRAGLGFASRSSARRSGAASGGFIASGFGSRHAIGSLARARAGSSGQRQPAHHSQKAGQFRILHKKIAPIKSGAHEPARGLPRTIGKPGMCKAVPCETSEWTSRR